jgi:hypothetical protein
VTTLGIVSSVEEDAASCVANDRTPEKQIKSKVHRSFIINFL